ncbi:unnamed protein product, partial [marine sediment metagenome]
IKTDTEIMSDMTSMAILEIPDSNATIGAYPIMIVIV